MTKPFLEVTGQPPFSTENGKTDKFPHDHDSKTNKQILKQYHASEKIYSDQMGRFPITSSKVIKYAMIVYEYNSSNIHGEPIKYFNAEGLTRAYKNYTEC